MPMTLDDLEDLTAASTPKKKSLADDLPDLNAQPAPNENRLLNAIRGFSGRGNEVLAAVNPWADQDKIAAEKEWIKQHPGAGIGQTIADIAITLPAGGLASLPARALATGAIEGATHVGDLSERIKQAGLGALGSGLGEKAGEAVSFMLHPFRETTNIATKKLIQKAKDIGIKLNAAQITGDKSLQYADKALHYIPSSSEGQQAFKDAQKTTWQKALLALGHEAADNARPETMGAMKDRIQAVYRDVTSRNALNIDQQMKNELQAVEQKLMGRIPVNQKTIVKSYLRDFNTVPVGAHITGAEYQDIRSLLEKQTKAFKNSDPATYEALKSIRETVDKAMERSLNNMAMLGGKSGDLAAWKQANQDWMVMKNIEGATDPLSGEIDPGKFLSNLVKKDANRVLYGKGNQEMTKLARVGKEFLKPKTNDSGTAQTAAAIKYLTGAELGGLGVLAYSHPAEAAIAASAALGGQILLPKAASRVMNAQGGYLTQGLLDLEKEALPGLTRRKIIEELMRNSGVQTSQ